jgi:hypothetical protein
LFLDCLLIAASVYSERQYSERQYSERHTFSVRIVVATGRVLRFALIQPVWDFCTASFVASEQLPRRSAQI